MEENIVTVESVLSDVCRILCEIKAPMALFDDVCVPIGQAINGIRACINAIREADKKAKAKAEGKGEADA